MEVISKEEVKPATPTPDSLKTYELSFLDQIFPHYYLPIVLFYPNESSSLNNVVQERRTLLKQSLSETLTSFYPLSGKVQGNSHIDCNDDGVYYVEAKTSECLSDFLYQPDNKSIHRLLPFRPGSVELLSQTYMAMVQITLFNCGGISIGIYTSHKMIDGHSRATFVKAWAAVACRSSEQILPSFVSPSLFPPVHGLPADPILSSPPGLNKNRRCVTKRFVFSASSLAMLKIKAASSLSLQYPSRVMAVTGLLWKCCMKVSRKRSDDTKLCFLSVPVNIRPRSTPALPPYAIGNIFWPAFDHCNPNEDPELEELVRRGTSAINKINSEFVEKIKGEKGCLHALGYLNEVKRSNWSEIETFSVTSLVNAGHYEVDFGWGKPIWISIADADEDIVDLRNLVKLMDTRSGNGIEAWVNLYEEDMAIFEHDAELLAFASVDPSPLQSY